MTAPKSCPKCRTPLSFDDPTATRFRCPNCQSVLALRDRGSNGGLANTPPVTPASNPTAPVETILPQPSSLVRRTSPVGLEPSSNSRALASTVPTSPQPEPSGGVWRGRLIAVGVFLVAGTILAIAFSMRDGGDKESKGTTESTKDKPEPTKSKEAEKSKPTGPTIQIDEDFKAAGKQKLPLPKGWSEGEAFRIAKAPETNDRYWLEVGRAGGAYTVQAPPVDLRGDFTLECAYFLDQGQALTLMVRDSAKTSALPLGVDHLGHISIGNDIRQPPPSYKINPKATPTYLRVKREGQKLTFFLNDDLVGSKNLERVAAFDTIELGLPGTKGRFSSPARIFLLRVVSQSP